jgi:hypothetical protein
MIDITEALRSLRPDAEWALYGERLEWLDKTQTQPSDDEIQAEIKRLAAEKPNKIAKVNRQTAYEAEADPLFFKYQRGEIIKQLWLDKVAEIKARYPYIAELEQNYER